MFQDRSEHFVEVQIGSQQSVDVLHVCAYFVSRFATFRIVIEDSFLVWPPI